MWSEREMGRRQNAATEDHLKVMLHISGELEITVLAELTTGERARIVAIEGGRGLRQKLFLRGLFEGKVVRVISNYGYGPVTIEVDRSVVAIGRGMAQKIMVTRC